MSNSPITSHLRALPLAALALLAACERKDPTQAVDPRAIPARKAPDAIDEPQAVAFEAGKDLIGSAAPKLTFRTIDGAPITLGQVRADRPTYLKFWATWCMTCRAQMESFRADFARYGKDMDVVAVNTGINDDRAAVESYRRDVGLSMPIVIDDGRLGEALHLKVTPQHVIIGRDGTIRYIGHLEDQRLQHEIQAAIADRPIARGRVAGAAASHLAGARPASVGAPLPTVQGGQVRIDGAASGVPRLLYFLSPWCETYLKDTRPAVASACRRTREALSRASEAGRAQVVGIASGLSTDADGVRRFLARTAFEAPIVMDDDGALFRRFEVRRFPTVIRLDASGRPAGRLTIGQIDALACSPEI